MRYQDCQSGSGGVSDIGLVADGTSAVLSSGLSGLP